MFTLYLGLTINSKFKYKTIFNIWVIICVSQKKPMLGYMHLYVTIIVNKAITWGVLLQNSHAGVLTREDAIK